MTPERWRQVEEVYNAVVAHPVPERAGVLAELCSGDQGLRHEVESLLVHAAGASAFLATPALSAAGVAGEQALIGRRFGTYLVQSFLDAGGMGEVYQARERRSIARSRSKSCRCRRQRSRPPRPLPAGSAGARVAQSSAHRADPRVRRRRRRTRPGDGAGRGPDARRSDRRAGRSPDQRGARDRARRSRTPSKPRTSKGSSIGT